MNYDFAIHLSDIRLLQTMRLLESAMRNHPDQGAVKEALDAIGVARENLTQLTTAPEIGRVCCA